MTDNHAQNGQIKNLLSYSPESGLLTWITKRGFAIKPGTLAGGLDKYGYVTVGVSGKQFKAHRIAWLLMTGDWPQKEIDHINGNRADNRWINLRQVDRLTNVQNLRAARKDSKSGLLGVRARKGGFYATIGHNKKTIHLGVFDSPEKAHEAYIRAKRELHAGATI